MWSGEGWKRTQRQLGVLGLVAAFAIEVGFNTDVPIFIYASIWSLLGLDYLIEALDRLRP